MREFSNIGGFIAHLTTMAAAETSSLQAGLKKVANAIEQTAKSEFGHYQDDAPPSAGGVELADSTKKDRLSKGFTENDPRKRSGKLQKSISNEVSGLDAVIGSDDEIMLHQELGTSTISPRAVFGPAAIRNKSLILKTLGEAAAEGLLYGSGSTLTK